MKKPYYRFFLGDYIAKTIGLTLVQHGAYHLLLDWYYTLGHSLPTDKSMAYRACGAVDLPEKQAVDYVLSRYFTKESNGYVNDKCESEIAWFHKQIENGRKGGEAKSLAKHKPESSQTPSQNVPFQNPESRIQNPEAKLHTPEPEQEKSQELAKPLRASRPGKALEPAKPAKSAEVWQAYSGAYFGRYGAEPPRNTRTNVLLGQLVDRLGATEAPAVAAFYLTHNNSFYLLKGHPPNLLLADAEKLRTEWATGRQINGSKARQIERASNTMNATRELIEEMHHAKP